MNGTFRRDAGACPSGHREIFLNMPNRDGHEGPRRGPDPMSGQIVPCASQRAPDSFTASRRMTSTNSRPMTLRLASGSETPAGAAKNCAKASTCATFAWSLPANVSTSMRPSLGRSSPWSTKTQVRRSPVARWMSAAATLVGRVFEMQRRAGMDAAMDRMRSRRGLGEARQELRSEICPENRGQLRPRSRRRPCWSSIRNAAPCRDGRGHGSHARPPRPRRSPTGSA